MSKRLPGLLCTQVYKLPSNKCLQSNNCFHKRTTPTIIMTDSTIAKPMGIQEYRIHQ